MRYLVLFALLAMSAALVAAGWALKQRFQQGAHIRIAICQSENTLRKILHDEHVRKLRNSIEFLKQHPSGIDGISRDLILRGIQDEREIVAKTRSKVCV